MQVYVLSPFEHVSKQLLMLHFFLITALETDSDVLPFSQTSTTSDWLSAMKSTRELYNEAMKILSRGEHEDLKYQASLPLNMLQTSSRSYYINHAKSAFLLICERIAPGQAEALMNAVVKLLISKTSDKPSTVNTDTLTETVVEAYKKAEDHTTRVQILSLIVNKYTKAQLLDLIGGLTVYKIDSARKHAQSHGPGSYIAPPKITRMRLSKGKIQHFIEFISAPMYLQTVGFGSKHLKLSSGLEVKIPKVIRTMIASRLINAYNAYCDENDVTPPSKATLYKIVKACSASQLKSLQGLDNHQHEGNVAFETLERVVDKMVECGAEHNRGLELKKGLKSLKSHLKHDFSSHTEEESSCVQHCTKYALSEAPCSHTHSETCVPCSDITVLSDHITEWISSVTLSTDQQLKEEVEHDVTVSFEKIVNWRNHIIRTTNQEACKLDFLENIQHHQVLLISDWAMKYLPHTFREAQSEWFGKQGISWHVTCALMKSDDPDERYKIMSFIHLLANGNQGWFCVSQILLDTIRMLKEKQPHLKEVYLRSDNAGCYHSFPLLCFLWRFREDLPLELKEYNFSEAQSGKDLCDSRTGCCRLHILNYINEGHNVTNVWEMKVALDSHGGIRNTFCSIIDVDMSLQPSVSNTSKVPISLFNNFKFTDSGVISRKAYKIGGELICAQKMDAMSLNISEVHLNDAYQVSPFNSLFTMIRPTSKLFYVIQNATCFKKLPRLD